MDTAALVVSADEPNRAALCEALRDAGYGVTAAADGATALEMLRQNLSRKRPHRLVVVLEQALPEMDGVAVVRAIAADPHLASHHAYVLLAASAEPTWPEGDEALAHLSITVVPRPTHRDTLVEVIAQAACSLGMWSEGAGRRD